MNEDNEDLVSSDGKVLLKRSERTRTEVWTRVMGYHRPISEYNIGKRAEHDERKHFVLRSNSSG